MIRPPPVGKVRLFISLPVSEFIAEKLQALQAMLRPRFLKGHVRWTPPEQFHLTLVFLGNVPANGVAELIDLVTVPCALFPPLSLGIKGLGCFPAGPALTVIWTEAFDLAQALPSLQTAIAGITRGFGDHVEKQSYRPHVTLGRMQKLHSVEARLLEKTIQETDQRPTRRPVGQWTVTHVHVMRSEPSRDGSHHVLLAKIPLGTPAS